MECSEGGKGNQWRAMWKVGHGDWFLDKADQVQ